jgi:hypothetical protein
MVLALILAMEKLMPPRIQKTKSVLFSLVIVGQGAIAAEIGVELEVGIGETDNITRANDTVLDPALDDTIYRASVALDVDHQSARSDVELRGLVAWMNYRDGPYESETLPALDATAIFRITDEALSWFATGNVGQQSVDPFQPVTPENRQDVTYLTTGPTLSIPLSSRTALRVDAWYSDISYDSQPLDNHRTGAQLGIVRQINPRRSLSLNVRAENTAFDDEAVFPEIDRTDAFIAFDTEGSRNVITAELGFSRFKRLDVETDEPLATIEWERQLSPATSLILNAGTQVSDASDSFRDVQGDSLDLGDVQNQQSVSAPFREEFAGASINYGTTRTTLDLGGRWGKEEYGDSVFAGSDRDVQQLSLNVSRQLGRGWMLAGFGRSERREYDQLDRRDEDTSVGASLTWQQLRTIGVELRFERFELDSTEAGVEFTENRIYLGLRYIPDFG